MQRSCGGLRKGSKYYNLFLIGLFEKHFVLRSNVLNFVKLAYIRGSISGTND